MSDGFGQAAVGLGDLNGDGHADLGVGAYGVDDGGSNAGAVYAFFGPVTGGASAATADLKLVGAAASDILGVYLPGAGDVNGDGVHDLVAGSANYDGGGSNAGGVFVVLGPATGTIAATDADLVIHGTSEEKAGYTSAFVGDTDGDGTDDLLVGAADANLGGQTEGAAYLFVGGSPEPVRRVVLSGRVRRSPSLRACRCRRRPRRTNSDQVPVASVPRKASSDSADSSEPPVMPYEPMMSSASRPVRLCSTTSWPRGSRARRRGRRARCAGCRARRAGHPRLHTGRARRC